MFQPKTWPRHWIDAQCVGGKSRVIIVESDVPLTRFVSPLVVIVSDLDGRCEIVAEPWTLEGAYLAFAVAIEREVARQDK